jgi:DNA-binding SARP family transcriptional activator
VDIRLIGPPEIIDVAGTVRPIRGHQAWLLLARLLLTDRPVSRRTLGAELFPTAEDPLGALRWCLAGLRRAVDSKDAFAGDPVTPNLPAGTTIDVAELNAGRFDVDRAGAGDLLDGIDARCSPELDTWLLVQRQRIAGVIDAALRGAVRRSLSAGDVDRAVELATLAVQRAVLDEGNHVLLVQSLVAAGSHQAAAAHVEEAERLFRVELGVEPTPALRSAARRHLAGPPVGVSRRAMATSLLESGRAALAAGAVDAGLECLRRAADNAAPAVDQRLAAACLLELGSALVHSVRSHDDEGAILLQRGADRALAVDATDVATDAYRELGYVDALAGRRPSAHTHLERARQLAGRDERLLAGVEAVTGFNLADWGHADEARAHYEEAVALARRTGNPRREAWSLGLGGWARLGSGDLDMADDWIRRCLQLTTDTQWIAFRPWPLSVYAELQLATGSASPATLVDLDQTFALSCTMGDPCWEGASARVIALTHAEHGDHDRALEWITRARERCVHETDTFVGLHAAILASDAHIAIAAGDHERRDGSARALVALAARCHMDAYLADGLELLLVGD